MSTIIDGTTGITFPDASTQAKAVSQVTPFAVTASAIAGAELQLPEATANGVNYVAVKAADALAANLTFTLPAADGTAGQVLQTNGSGALAFATAAVAYPQNIQTANYTLVLGDAGKQIFHPASDVAVRTYTIPANSSVAFPIGTVVLFTVENGGTGVGVSITSDTLVFGGGSTGTLSVLPNNTLMAIKVTATKWMANYLYQTGTAAPFGNPIAIAHTTTPFISAYAWSSSTGFGTRFFDPATLPTGTGNDLAFSPAGNAIAVAHATSPFISAYPWSATGFGTKYTNPATLPTGAGNDVAFSPASNAIAVAHTTSPLISAYPWNVSTGFGTKYTDPATLPAGTTGLSVAFSPAGDAIAVTGATTPFIQVYPWNVSTGFGTKYADPSILPGAGGNSTTNVAFSPAGDAIAVTSTATSFIFAYPWNVSTGFGTKYTDPATLPGTGGNGVAFSPAGNVMAVAHSGTPFISVYPWSVGTGFGTKYTNPATLPTGVGNDVAFNPAGDTIAVAHTTSPYIAAYPWNVGTGFGTIFSNPTTLPTGTGNGVAFTTV